MRVDVDEARRDQAALGVDLAAAPALDPADGGDAVAVDGDVGLPGPRPAPGPVDDGPIAYHQVVHRAPLRSGSFTPAKQGLDRRVKGFPPGAFNESTEC